MESPRFLGYYLRTNLERLKIQAEVCPGCGDFIFPQRHVCPRCHTLTRDPEGKPRKTVTYDALSAKIAPNG